MPAVARSACRSAIPLEEDLESDLGRATRLEKLDRAMQIDVMPGGKGDRAVGRVAGALQALGTPTLDLLELGILDGCGGCWCHFSSSFVLRRRSISICQPYFGQTYGLVYTMPGDIEA
jgi:hypothetical protein